MHIHRKFGFNFFLGVTPVLVVEIWLKWKILLKQFVSVTPLKPLNRISWNFVAMKDITCRCAYRQEILIQFFFWSYALFEHRNFILFLGYFLKSKQFEYTMRVRKESSTINVQIPSLLVWLVWWWREFRINSILWKYLRCFKFCFNWMISKITCVEWQ